MAKDECAYPNCATSLLEKNLNEVKSGIEEIKATQSKLMEFFSDYKVLLLEIKNLNLSFSKLEMENKEMNAMFFKELRMLNERKLEKDELRTINDDFKKLENTIEKLNDQVKLKADKDEVKESRNWLWHLVTGMLAVLIAYYLKKP